MKDIPKMLYVFVGIVTPILFTLLFLIVSNKVSLSIKGFAVDSEDMLYVGKNQKIEVYNGDDLINIIPLMTSKGYAFTIQDDQLIIAAISKKFILDLDGNIIEEYDDTLTKTYNGLYAKRKEFKTIKGTKYKASNILGYYTIIRVVDKSSTVIYKTPLLDYIVKLIVIVLVVSFFVFVPIIVYKCRKNINKNCQ